MKRVMSVDPWKTEEQKIRQSVDTYKRIRLPNRTVSVEPWSSLTWGRQKWPCQPLFFNVLFTLKYSEFHPGSVFSWRMLKIVQLYEKRLSPHLCNENCYKTVHGYFNDNRKKSSCTAEIDKTS